MSTALMNTAPVDRMFRLNPQTHRPAPVEGERPNYAFPPVREYLLQFTGISDVFQLPSYNNPDELASYFRFEFTVHRSKQFGGQIVSVLWTPKLGDKANLGKWLPVIRGGQQVRSNEKKIELTDYLGRFFWGTIVPNEPGTKPKVTNPRVATDEELTGWGITLPPNLGKEEHDANVPDDDEPDDDDRELVGAAVGGGGSPFDVEDDE